MLTGLGEPLSLPAKLLNILAKKLNYRMVPTKEVKLKKKINSNIGDKNIIKGLCRLFCKY